MPQTPPEEKILRKLLWLRHGCTGLYGDDGEMQCGSCLLDFKRDAPEAIEKRFQEIGLRRYLAQQSGKPE